MADPRMPFGGRGPEGKQMRAPDVNPIAQKEGGVPFYGNLYQGRVNSMDYNPPMADGEYGKTQEALLKLRPVYRDDDPAIRAKLDRCPYFALNDMCVWHGMDPKFLDPGVLSDDEHHLLLLYSRSYYDKWKKIHAQPREFAPALRIKRGRFDLTRELLDMLCVPTEQQEKLNDLGFDDSCLIALHPKKWVTAHLDPRLRDLLTGRVLEIAGVAQYQRDRLYDTINHMRTICIVRKDLNHDREEYRNSMWQDRYEDEERLFFPYSGVRTLHDLHTRLGLETYTGQVKLYNFYDETKTRLTLTLADEDAYFDFLVRNFYNANLTLYGQPSLSRYTLVVESFENVKRNSGRWF